MFKKNDTLRNVLLAGLACLALIFAGCNQAVDDGGNYVNFNDGEPVTVAAAVDAITNQRGGTIYVKIGPDDYTGDANAGDTKPEGDILKLVSAIRNNPQVMVELDLSESWKDIDEAKEAAAAGTGTSAPDFFGATLDASGEPGGRKFKQIGKVADGTFSGLKNLASISLPFTVGSIGPNAFEDCENLETVTINFFFTADVDKTNLRAVEYMYDDKFMLTEIGQAAFYGCKNLRTFVLVSDPDNDDVDEGFPVSLTKIDSGAFTNCYSLEGIRFLNTRNLGYDFIHEVDGVDFVEHAVKPDATNYGQYYWEDPEGVLRNTLTKESSGVGSVDGITGTADASDIEIGTYAFANCKSLEYIDFTNKKNVKGVLGIAAAADKIISDSAFSGCESLSRIIYPTATDRTGDYAAYGSYELGSDRPGVGGPHSDANVVKFAHITQFGDESFQFSAIGNETLHDLFHLTDYVEFGGNDASGDEVTKIGKRAFFGCKEISEVLLPGTITNVAGLTGLGDGAFANTSVEYIWVHNSTNVFSILEEYKGGPNKDTPAPFWTGALVSSDPALADKPTTIFAWFVSPFSGDLTYLPQGDSQNPKTKVLGDKLTAIKGDAFYNNVDVEKILFPASLKNGVEGIGNYAFANAENLEEASTELTAANWKTATDDWQDPSTPAGDAKEGYYGTFVNTQVYKIKAFDVDSGAVAR